MSKGHVDLKSQGASQRRLNVIYFIDSAKTRSMSIPLGRLNVLLALIFLIFSWSIASIFVIIWLGEEQLALSTRLKASLGTIFDYQSRFDNVYEVAYPPVTHAPDAGLDPAPLGLRAEEYAEHAPSDASRAQASSGTAASEPPAAAGAAASPDQPPRSSPTAAAEPSVSTQPITPPNPAAQPVPPTSPTNTANSVENRAGASTTGDGLVTVGNPTLEKGSNGVTLHFELANRSTRTRAEGYIWAIAEFVGDDGQKSFIGAPRELKLNANGEPANPEKATYFGIKRFKKQSFNFPLSKGRAGTFTAVRIGIMDLSGEGRRAYRLSTEVRVR